MISESISTSACQDRLQRSEEDIASVSEYQISRSLDNFIINITYKDSIGKSKKVKYIYKVTRKITTDMAKEKAGAPDYITRGDVIDAFDMIEEDTPRLRKKLVEVPVFSPMHILPASPI